MESWTFQLQVIVYCQLKGVFAVSVVTTYIVLCNLCSSLITSVDPDIIILGVRAFADISKAESFLDLSLRPSAALVLYAAPEQVIFLVLRLLLV